MWVERGCFYNSNYKMNLYQTKMAQSRDKVKNVISIVLQRTDVVLHRKRKYGKKENINPQSSSQQVFPLQYLSTRCPNKHGNSVTTFISSSIHAAFLLQYLSSNIYRKRLVLRFSKCGLPFFLSSKLTEILQNVYKFQFV